ncbi:MAG: type IVB secretion system protein DotG/IcmE [Legionella sp.]|nr:type IVB secretion system protein DotG/IcmE [Legionella sp.]
MASKKENLKALFTNTRSRVIIVFTLLLLGLTVAIGVIKIRGSSFTGIGERAQLTSAPGTIQSIPGSVNPTAQYAHLQEAQNVNQARVAMESGGSAIPTLIRSQKLGSGADVVGGNPGGVGFATLSREATEGGQRKRWIELLRDSHCSKDTLTKILEQGGKLADLKEVCDCAQLKNIGYTGTDLQTACSCQELKALGFSARQFKDAGFTAERLRDCGLSACEVRGAGYTAQEMRVGGYTAGELKGAGFPESEVVQTNPLPSGVTLDDLRKAGNQPDALKRFHSLGVPAATLHDLNGSTAEQLRAAGYTGRELKNAGFSPQDLKAAGLSAADLKDAGFDAADLKAAGFSADALKRAGFSPAELAKAGFAADELKTAGLTAAELKQAGYSPLALKRAGFTPEALKAAGFSEEDLKQDAHLPSGITPEAVKKAACDPEALRALRVAGVSAASVHDLNNCTADVLKAAGYTATDLKNAGFTPEALKAAGFSAADLKNAGFDAGALKAAGFSADELKRAGFTPSDLKKLGFSPKDLKAAGFSPDALKAAGALAGELKEAGFSAEALKQAGFTPAELKAAGFTPEELKNAGVSAGALKNAGFGARELRGAGFSAGILKDAGFSPQALAKAGFSPDVLKAAGFSNSDLHQAGLGDGLAGFGINADRSLGSVGMPGVPGMANQQAAAASNSQQLQAMVQRQNQQMSDQRFQQRIQQRISEMTGAASQSLSGWQKIAAQAYIAGNEKEEKERAMLRPGERVLAEGQRGLEGPAEAGQLRPERRAMIKMGDILFAVLDTSINSDEPGPILATIVSGKLKGAKLIGSFTLPKQGDKMVINFNAMSIPGAPRSMGISAYAIDPDTARTALASRSNHHYLLRYGSLFASSFLEGFGNAFQSANTTVTIGGTGGGNNVTVQNGINRSALQNAVIGLATLGKSWGQAAQQQFNRPTTVELFSGSGLGILFTQDVAGF